MAARLLMFPRRTLVAADGRAVAPVSPFRHLMPERPLTPREVLHRNRMLEQMLGGAPPRRYPFPRR